MKKILNSYPVNNASQVKEAQEYFNENLSLFRPDERIEIAKGMYKACITNKVPIEKNASYNSYFNFVSGENSKCADSFKNSIEERKIIVGDINVGDTEKTASSFLDELLELYYQESAPCQKIAEILNNFDMQNGISQHWDDKILDPYLSVSSNAHGFEENVFSKVAGKLDIIDVINASFDENIYKEASKRLSKEVGDRFVENPYKFLNEEDHITKEALMNTINDLIEV